MASEAITRNDLTEILDKVLPFLDDWTELKQKNLTVTNWNVVDSTSTGTMIALRRGGVVTIKFNGVKLKATSGRIDFATIPEGFRPPTEVANVFDQTSIWFFCRPNGTIAVQNSLASTYWGAITFVAQ